MSQKGGRVGGGQRAVTRLPGGVPADADEAAAEAAAAEAAAKVSANKKGGALPKGFEAKAEPEPAKSSRGTLPKGF